MAARRFPILFIAPSRIGDAVLASGLVRRLEQEIPEAAFTIVAGPLAAPLFAEVPRLQGLVALEKRPVGLHWLDLWRATAGRPWGLVVDTRGSGLAGLLRARRRATHRPGGPPVHKVVEAARLLKLEDDPPAPFLYAGEAHQARAAELAAGPGPILALAPVANWIGKTWPAERFGLLARALLGPGGPLDGGRLMVLGGPADRDAAQPVLSALPRARVIDLVGTEDLLTIFAVLSRVRLFVGCDSGLMHMAAAAGAPTLGLFGPSDETLYAPWGPLGRTIRGPRSFEEIRRLDPRLDQALCHMMDLKVPDVLAAARGLLADTEPPPAASPEAEIPSHPTLL